MEQQNNDPINALPEYEVRTMKDDLDKLEGKITEPNLVNLKVPEIKPEPPKDLPIVNNITQSLKPTPVNPKPLPKKPLETKKSSLPDIEDFIVEAPVPKIVPVPTPVPAIPPKPVPVPRPTTKPIIQENDGDDTEEIVEPRRSKKLLTVLLAIIILGLVIGLGYWLLTKSKPVEPVNPPVNNEPKVSASLIKVDATKTFKVENNTSLIDLLINEENSNQPDKTLERIVPTKTNGNALSLSELIQELKLYIPPYTLAELKDNYTLLVYKQGAQQRMSLVIETNNPNNFATTITSWENTMPKDLQEMFLNHQPSNLNTKGFSNNQYRDTSIRFVNFPTPELTIDYAVSNNLFLISTSRESGYNIIDRLK